MARIVREATAAGISVSKTDCKDAFILVEPKPQIMQQVDNVADAPPVRAVGQAVASVPSGNIVHDVVVVEDDSDSGSNCNSDNNKPQDAPATLAPGVVTSSTPFSEESNAKIEKAKAALEDATAKVSKAEGKRSQAASSLDSLVAAAKNRRREILDGKIRQNRDQQESLRQQEESLQQQRETLQHQRETLQQDLIKLQEKLTVMAA
ncbi:expressed unknown protein [Seminavis robusta]|uniref:Uncharacterized protein n=1 Tax=Seminavis robusta TaxID=568900 RepID=A0A9N8HF23_9STRA|nr:expressed unknown protein [Seminavis robusta]|eukprot:Sro412_g137800.1 n/a (206) ;mRNA; r:14782-15503